jgi:hypothetical protein
MRCRSSRSSRRGVELPRRALDRRTLIQLYFHRFHAPLAEDRAPPPVVSPIETEPYAIQDAPWRPWREIAVFAALVGVALVMLVRR